jgi:hypothetical protein
VVDAARGSEAGSWQTSWRALDTERCDVVTDEDATAFYETLNHQFLRGVRLFAS